MPWIVGMKQQWIPIMKSLLQMEASILASNGSVFRGIMNAKSHDMEHALIVNRQILYTYIEDGML